MDLRAYIRIQDYKFRFIFECCSCAFNCDYRFGKCPKCNSYAIEYLKIIDITMWAA